MDLWVHYRVHSFRHRSLLRHLKLLHALFHFNIVPPILAFPCYSNRIVI